MSNFLIFDTETISPTMEDFPKAHECTPVVAVLLLVDGELNYIDHRKLAAAPTATGFDNCALTKEFWGLVTAAMGTGAKLVSFAGQTFDVPVMELQGLKCGTDLSAWFKLDAKSWEDPRNMYGTQHLDLCTYLAGRYKERASLDALCKALGLPGKVSTTGNDVGRLVAEKKFDQIVDYCCCDVLNTYGLLFSLLHSMRWVQYPWTDNRVDNPFKHTIDKMVCGPETSVFRDLIRADNLF